MALPKSEVVGLYGKAFLGAKDVPYYRVRFLGSDEKVWIPFSDISSGVVDVPEAMKDSFELAFALAEEKLYSDTCGAYKENKKEGVEEQSKWKARRVLQFIDDESAEGKIEKRRNEFKAEAPDAFTWPNASTNEFPTLSDSDLDRYDSSFINDASELSTFSTPTPNRKKDKIKIKAKPPKRILPFDSDSDEADGPCSSRMAQCVKNKQKKLAMEEGKKEEQPEVITLD